MIITIRKSDNKLITWNGGNLEKNPAYSELNVEQDRLPVGDISKIFYDPEKKELYVDNDYIDPVIQNMKTKQELNNIDIKSIRSIREWLAKQATAPQFIKDYETEAIEKRKELK